jgi:hypothetical protein
MLEESNFFLPVRAAQPVTLGDKGEGDLGSLKEESGCVFPKSLIEFQDRFPDEESCWRYLREVRLGRSGAGSASSCPGPRTHTLALLATGLAALRVRRD